MSDPTTRMLDETLQERVEALPPADFTADGIRRAARRKQRRQRTYGALGGAAAAAVVVALALQSGQLSSAPPQPAQGPVPVQTSLTIDQAARANASHAWAASLPAGPPEDRQLGYELVRRGERVAVIRDRGEALLPEGVAAVSSPTKVADGWLFIGHGPDQRGEAGVDHLGSTMIHVRDDLTVRTLVEADVVTGLLPSSDGQRAAVVTGTRSGEDQVEHDTVRFLRLDTTESLHVALGEPEASMPATWVGDRVTFVGQLLHLGSPRLAVYDVAERRWLSQQPPVLDGRASQIGLLAAAAAQGGSTSQALVALLGEERACAHVLDGSAVADQPLFCAPSDVELRVRVSPGGRYAVVGQARGGRLNVGEPARIIDLSTGRDVPGVPQELLDVGAFFLMWEDDQTLIGQATRATPVHDAAAQFRWDLVTRTGESLEFDPEQGPMPRSGPESPLLL